ncbi:MAG: bifunctional oligoribonuclease/PAP phosphatase NrnA [Spirochaetota bacterium]
METKKLLEAIKSGDQYILTTHKNCDPDGIGAELGMSFLLAHLGKKHSILNPDPTPERYQFLDPHYRINHIVEGGMRENRQSQVLILDNSDLSRIGEVSQFIADDKKNVIVVDHHDNVENKQGIAKFFIFPDYSSTSEIVYELLQLEDLEPDYTTATALYMGIVMDTGQFKYRKTSPRTHRAAADLLQYKLPIETLSRKLFEDYPLEVLYLKRDILSTIEVHDSIAMIFITRKMLESYSFTRNPVEGLINELLGPRDIQIAVSFSEAKDGRIKLSFRSKGDFDVCRIAKEFSGGGHKNAAGGIVSATMLEAKKRVLANLKSSLEIQERHYAV